jgi:hypothetical protein
VINGVATMVQMAEIDQPGTMRCACCGADIACDGCGSRLTIEEIRAKHPRAIACCPERKLVAALPIVETTLR